MVIVKTYAHQMSHQRSRLNTVALHLIGLPSIWILSVQRMDTKITTIQQSAWECHLEKMLRLVYRSARRVQFRKKALETSLFARNSFIVCIFVWWGPTLHQGYIVFVFLQHGSYCSPVGNRPARDQNTYCIPILSQFVSNFIVLSFRTRESMEMLLLENYTRERRYLIKYFFFLPVITYTVRERWMLQTLKYSNFVL